MSRLLSFLVGLLIAAPFYLLLIDTTSTPELIAGSVAAVIAAAAFSLAYADGAGHGSYQVRWLTASWRVITEVPREIVIVCTEITAQLLAPRSARGQLRATRFRSSDDEARDRGRNAVAEALGSLAPNTIVIGVDRDAQTLLVHQLRRRGEAEQLDPLGLADAT